MKLIVDVGVGLVVEEALRQAGHDVLSVRAIDPRMPDRDILDRAAAERRILVTMDKDFGDLAVRRGAAHAGVLLLRTEEASASEKVRIVTKIIDEHGERLGGHVSVYQAGRLRIRRSG